MFHGSVGVFLEYGIIQSVCSLVPQLSISFAFSAC